jgi:hypothetical protein
MKKHPIPYLFSAFFEGFGVFVTIWKRGLRLLKWFNWNWELSRFAGKLQFEGGGVELEDDVLGLESLNRVFLGFSCVEILKRGWHNCL